MTVRRRGENVSRVENQLDGWLGQIEGLWNAAWIIT
jgi:hypothetical protein